MELSRSSEMEAGMLRGLGRCRHFFWLGVVFDAVGATVLFIGIFADLLFYDLLLYLGSIIIFLSLLWWVFWYTGNIELSPEETWKRPIRVGTLSQHLSFTFNISSTLARVRRGQRRRRLLQSAASLLSRSLTVQVHKPLSEEDQAKDGMESGRDGVEAEDWGPEDLGPEPEAVKRSQGVCPPGPEAGPLGPKAGRPSGHLVQPKFTSSALDQPLPAIASSKSLPMVPSSSSSQPLTISYSKSLPNSLASASYPLVTIDSASLPGVPLPSTGQLLDTLVSDTETASSMASQSHHLLVHVPAQSHFRTPVDSERGSQNPSLASQTQPTPVQAFQSQTLASQGSLFQLTPAPFFQTLPVDPWVTLAVQDFEALYNTQQAPMSTALVQEIEPSQSPQAPEPSGGQELRQEVPDAISPLPESLAVATEAQQPVPHESAPAPTTHNNRHL